MASPKRLPLLLSIALAVPVLCQISKAQSPDAKVKPTGSISGRIMISGKPAAGIAVAVFSSEAGSNRRISAAQTTTDSEGHYRLPGLAAGQYQVTALAPNLTDAEANLDTSGFFYGASKGILLGAGEQVGDIDLKLSRGAVISGRVTDADNRPVVEERVLLQVITDRPNMPTRLPYFTYAAQMNITDDRGIFRIYGLPAGRYKVSVGSEGTDGPLGSGRPYYQKTYHPDVTDASRAEIIELLEGSEATNVDIRVGSRQQTFSVSGYVTDETGAPVNGGRVGFTVVSNNPDRPSPTVSGYPLANGRFKFDGLAPGRYGAYVSSDFDGGDVYSDQVIFEIVDKDVTGLEIKATHGLSISGLIATDGIDLKDVLAQLPGLRVSVTVIPASGRVDASTIRSGGSATVNPDGSFQINGLRPGRVSFGAYSPNTAKRPALVRVEHGGVGVTQGFEIQPGQSVSGVNVVIAYGNGVIRGSVSFQGGTVPAGLRTFINCTRENSRSYAGGAQLDARGHFIIRGLAPGTYECTMQLLPVGLTPGQRPPRPQKQFVTVANDVETEVNFVADLGSKEVGP
jgi:uncharacterized protein (DUF2141 family)